jgi:beta-galactosidase
VRLPRYKAVLLSSFEFLGDAAQQKLLDYIENGGVVILGPQLPTLNERFAENKTLLTAAGTGAAVPLSVDRRQVATTYTIGNGRLVVIPRLADVASAVDEALRQVGIVAISKNDPQLDVAVHRDPSKPNRVFVFVANPTDRNSGGGGRRATLRNVSEIWEGRAVKASGTHWCDTLAPYTINTYEIEL